MEKVCPIRKTAAAGSWQSVMLCLEGECAWYHQPSNGCVVLALPMPLEWISNALIRRVVDYPMPKEKTDGNV